jgi:hypothetical protein
VQSGRKNYELFCLDNNPQLWMIQTDPMTRPLALNVVQAMVGRCYLVRSARKLTSHSHQQPTTKKNQLTQTQTEASARKAAHRLTPPLSSQVNAHNLNTVSKIGHVATPPAFEVLWLCPPLVGGYHHQLFCFAFADHRDVIAALSPHYFLYA